MTTPQEPNDLDPRITAWLLGELPPDDAADVAARVAADPELDRFCQDQRRAMDLLEEALLSRVGVPENTLPFRVPEPDSKTASAVRKPLLLWFTTPHPTLARVAVVTLLAGAFWFSLYRVLNSDMTSTPLRGDPTAASAEYLGDYDKVVRNSSGAVSVQELDMEVIDGGESSFRPVDHAALSVAPQRAAEVTRYMSFGDELDAAPAGTFYGNSFGTARADAAPSQNGFGDGRGKDRDRRGGSNWDKNSTTVANGTVSYYADDYAQDPTDAPATQFWFGYAGGGGEGGGHGKIQHAPAAAVAPATEAASGESNRELGRVTNSSTRNSPQSDTSPSFEFRSRNEKGISRPQPAKPKAEKGRTYRSLEEERAPSPPPPSTPAPPSNKPADATARLHIAGKAGERRSNEPLIVAGKTEAASGPAPVDQGIVRQTTLGGFVLDRNDPATPESKPKPRLKKPTEIRVNKNRSVTANTDPVPGQSVAQPTLDDSYKRISGVATGVSQVGGENGNKQDSEPTHIPGSDEKTKWKKVSGNSNAYRWEAAATKGTKVLGREARLYDDSKQLESLRGSIQDESSESRWANGRKDSNAPISSYQGLSPTEPVGSPEPNEIAERVQFKSGSSRKESEALNETGRADFLQDHRKLLRDSASNRSEEVDFSDAEKQGAELKKDVLEDFDQDGERSSLDELVSHLRSNVEGEEELREEEPVLNRPARPVHFNPFVDAANDPMSTFSIDVDTAAYTLARSYFERDLLPPADTVRTEEFLNFFEYNYAPPAKELFAVETEMVPTPFNDGWTLRVGVKGAQPARDRQRPLRLTVAVDTSGSMKSPARLALVQASLRQLIYKLQPVDQLAIVAYGEQATLLTGFTSGDQKEALLYLVNRLSPTGSTHLENGVGLAYEVAGQGFDPTAMNRVLLLSDGATNLGALAAEPILDRVSQFRTQGIFLSVFGYGNSDYNDELLEQLANKGDGEYRFIDSLREIERTFGEGFDAAMYPIAADVKIQVVFDTDEVNSHRQIGYENRQLKHEDFRNDTVDAGEVGSGQTVTALYQLLLKNPNPGQVATVFIRYRNVETGVVAEQAFPVRGNPLQRRFEDASTNFRLSACIAAFAEKLRGNPLATHIEYNEIATALEPVARERSLDPAVNELLVAVRRAPGMSRATH